MNRNQKPQFCIITPTAYLERFASQSSMHLVLAHLVDTDKDYADFYAERSEYKVMDNGAFELGQSYDPDRLVDLADRCRADAIVLPDYPAQPAAQTIDAALEFIPIVRSAGFQTFFCPQSEVGATEDWIRAYEWGSTNDLIDIVGMSILAIPNALPEIPRSYARVVMTKLLQDRGIFNYNKYHHYLGLNAGPALEIPPLLRMNALDSCDSSSPVWAGICGQMYNRMTDSYLMTRKIDKHVDFQYPMTDKKIVLDAIQTNIDMTLELFEELYETHISNSN